ncbi:zf-CCHC domain-containing protein, partial [Tanacetum coccineum]
MQNPKDSSDPTTAMNMTLTLLAKAFKVNTIPTNNNQRSSLIARNSQIVQPVQIYGNEVGQNAVQNPGIQIVENMNGLIAVSEIANQYGNGNVVTAPSNGNDNGINGNPIRCYNCRGEGHYASNCIVKSTIRDVVYLQQQLQIAQEEEARIQSTQEEFEFITAADAHEETERVKVNCTLKDTLQQASKSGTQFDNAPVYDSDGSAEVPKDEDCYDHHLFNTLTQEVQYTNLQTELDPYNDMQTKTERLQAQLGDLKVTANHDVCVLNYVNDMNSRADNQSANVSIRENQKKHKANANKPKELGSKEIIASSRPSIPRTCLRWILIGRISAMCGQLNASSHTENKSEKSMRDNASISNPSEPSSKGFSNSISLLG